MDTRLGMPWVVFEQKAWKLVRLSDFYLHDLKHGAASFMTNAGFHLYTVGNMIGHVGKNSNTRSAAAKLDVNWSKGV